MKILILSDSHGRSDRIFRAYDIEKPDMVIHLGDLEDMRDSVAARLDSPKTPCIFIKGNCDYSSQGDLQSFAVFTLKKHRFYCTHGHLVKVNYGLDTLLYTAEENNCDIALYGHTHMPMNTFMEGSFGGPKIHVLNPGSISLPRGGFERTYMIMELRESGAYDVKLKTL